MSEFRTNVRVSISHAFIAQDRQLTGTELGTWKRTLSSASANVFPRHVRGPSENERMCRWPWISFAFAIPPPPASSQRSGSNSLAFEPQKTSAEFMYRMGEVTTVPFPMTRLCVCAPDAVVRGVEKGMMSSSVACKLNNRIAVSGDLAGWSIYKWRGVRRAWSRGWAGAV